MQKLLLMVAIVTSQTVMAQNVGIGTTTPLGKLHISTGASGNLTPFSPLVVEGNHNTYINLLSPNIRETGLLFGKADNAASGAIVYNNENALNGFQFRTNGNVTQMILNNAGNVGIGLSTPNAKLSISSNGTELAGTAASNILRTNAGTLGITLESEISLANIGFLSPNNSSLGIRAYRSSPVTGWENTAILLGMDVDNTVRAGGGFLALSANGNIGVNTGTPQVSAALDVSSTTKGFLPPRMTQVQRDQIPPVEGLMIYNTETKKPNYFDGTGWKHFDGTSAATAIGVSYQGGIIAYILQPGDPGYIAGQNHGLIAAASDQSTGTQWGCQGTAITGADGTALGTGNQNTIDIMAGCATAGIAARLCGDLVLNGYSDWYLPSKDELNKLHINRVAVGGFSFSSTYWSSSEFDNGTAWDQNFNNAGFQFNDLKGTTLLRVRAVRAF